MRLHRDPSRVMARLRVKMDKWRIKLYDSDRPYVIQTHCMTDNCGDYAETEIEHQNKAFQYCWKHAYMVAIDILRSRLSSKQLFDRISDNCYKCAYLEVKLAFSSRKLQLILEEE